MSLVFTTDASFFYSSSGTCKNFLNFSSAIYVLSPFVLVTCKGSVRKMRLPPFLSSSYLLIFLLFLAISHSTQLEPSQSQTLLGIQELLNYPSVLSSWNHTTAFCNAEAPHPSVTVVCYQDNITQLLISGEHGSPPLLKNFSMHTLFTALGNLSSLKILSLDSVGLWGPIPASIGGLLSLEILSLSSNFMNGTIPMQVSSLKNLQSLILDDNMLTGQVPGWISTLPLLVVLSLKNNSLTGTLPGSLSSLRTLRILGLSLNHLSGEVPNFQNLTNLQVLDLEENSFGPHFPSLQPTLEKLVLRRNRFQFGIPEELRFFNHLERLDLSSNSFVGPFPPSVLSLPSLNYLDVGGNRLTGMLLPSTSCSDELAFVNFSSNLLTGYLPTCLRPGFKNRAILSFGNCLLEGDGEQHPESYCQNEAMAVTIPPSHEEKKKGKLAKAVLLASTIVGGGVVGTVLVCLVILVNRKGHMETKRAPTTRLISEKVSTFSTLKQLSDARDICQTMKLGAHGLPAYRVFTLEELKEATNNFDVSSFMGRGSHGPIYQGKLANGAVIAIRSLEMRKRQSSQAYTHDIELISKLRHSHLVSVLGHCFECSPYDSYVNRIYLVFECVSSSSLRECTSEALEGKKLTWAQRLAAAIGVTKGIQFLHTLVLPGSYSHNLNITDVLLDQNLHVKISTYTLLLFTETKQKVNLSIARGQHKGNIQERDIYVVKNDIYGLGLILLEVIVGRPIVSLNDMHVAKDLLLVSLRAEDIARRSVIDQEIQRECSDESLRTVMEICTSCLSDEPKDRPSVEDVLWNLQFAAQDRISWKTEASQSPQHSHASASP